MQEKKERIDQITQKFNSFNQKVTDICATAREKIEDVPVHISLDIDVPEYDIAERLAYCLGATSILVSHKCLQNNNNDFLCNKDTTCNKTKKLKWEKKKWSGFKGRW